VHRILDVSAGHEKVKSWKICDQWYWCAGSAGDARSERQSRRRYVVGKSGGGGGAFKSV